MKTFNINNIFAGWFNFSFNTKKNWDISYLSDVKDALDYVFNIEEYDSRQVILEMESLGNLLIITFKQYDTIYISVIEMDAEPLVYECYRFDYETFINDYVNEMESHKTDYINKFIDEDDDFEWDNEDYVHLKSLNKIKITKEGVLMNTKNKVYLAGPLFTREEQQQRKYDVAYLREHLDSDWEFFSPLEVELSLDDADITNAESTHDFYYSQDMNAIHNSTLAIIDLSNDDNGTLVELGLIKGLEIPYIIINSDFRLCETGGMHRNSFVRGIEKEALLVAKSIEEVVEFLKEQ